MQPDPFDGLPRGHFGSLLLDPPWKFYNWSRRPWWERSDRNTSRAVERHYETLSGEELAALPVGELAAEDAALFLWCCWPSIEEALAVVKSWGFTYKTCAFSWMKADPYRLFADDATPEIGRAHV